MDTRETNETGENLRVLVGTCEFHLSYFKKMLLKGSRIPKTPAHFNRLFETSSNPRATQSKQCIYIVVATCWILSEQTLNKRLQTSPETNFRWTSVIIQNQRRGKFEESGLRKVHINRRNGSNCVKSVK